MADRFTIEIPEGAPAGRFSIEIPEQPSEGLGARIDREISSIPRQLGLTARSAIKGPAEIVGILSDPVAALLSKATGRPMVTAGESAEMLANYIGLPKPESTTEKVVGKGVEMVSGMGGQTALAAREAARAAPGIAKSVYQSLAANPAQQLAAGAGGGVAGEYAKETGGGAGSQFVAALAGGVGGAGAAGVAQKAYTGINSLIGSLRSKPADINQINIQLDNILSGSGIDTGQIPGAVRGELLSEMQKAMKTGGSINPDVVRRIADYGVVGAKPMRGNVTLNPAQITQERNLMKMGANSTNKDLQMMSETARNNDMQLTGRLNELGANKAVDRVTAGSNIQSALKGIDAPRKAAVDAAYQAVRDSSGRYANLDVPTFSNLANNALDEQMLGSALPKNAMSLLNDVSSGKIPLNVNTMTQLDKRLSGLARDASASGDSQGALAIKQIRNALNQTPVESTAGVKALAQYDEARQLAANRFRKIEENPAMAAALDDSAPDKFVQTFILGKGNKANERDVMSLSAELRKDKEAFQSAKEQIAYHLKQKALSGNADEVGNFSPSAYNKALAEIGDKKLRMFFNKDEFAMMKAVGRVASYEKFQPTGSAVNNSNSASAFAGFLERIASSPLVSRIPFGGMALKEPAQQWAAQIQARQATSPLSALMNQQPRQKSTNAPLSSLLLPALATSQDR
jgi:hypothetical protein